MTVHLQKCIFPSGVMAMAYLPAHNYIVFIRSRKQRSSTFPQPRPKPGFSLVCLRQPGQWMRHWSLQFLFRHPPGALLQRYLWQSGGNIPGKSQVQRFPADLWDFDASPVRPGAFFVPQLRTRPYYICTVQLRSLISACGGDVPHEVRIPLRLPCSLRIQNNMNHQLYSKLPPNFNGSYFVWFSAIKANTVFN